MIWAPASIFLCAARRVGFRLWQRALVSASALSSGRIAGSGWAGSSVAVCVGTSVAGVWADFSSRSWKSSEMSEPGRRPYWLTSALGARVPNSGWVEISSTRSEVSLVDLLRPE